jgi:hypothetical protein
MNFLQLAQRTHTECGLSGVGPQGVSNQTGINAKLVSWVRQAWEELQSDREDWRWAWKQATVPLTAGQASYDLLTLIPDYGVIVRDAVTVTAPTDPNNVSEGVYSEYPIFSRSYERGVSAHGRPIIFTVAPDRSMRLAPTPDAAYNVILEYYAAPQSLSASTDTPLLPVHYHMAIVYRAVMLYAAHDDHPQLNQDAVLNYERWLRRIMATEAPQVRVSGVALDAY